MVYYILYFIYICVNKFYDNIGIYIGTRDLYWGPYSQENIESGRFIGKNIWKRKVVNSAAFGNEILGLRVDNKRGIRARYPDQDPEIAMQYDPISGWLLYDTVWKPPIKYPNAENVIVNASSYPNGMFCYRILIKI